MSYHNGQPIPLGLKMKDLTPRPKWMDDSMPARGFNVEDLVIHQDLVEKKVGGLMEQMEVMAV